MLHPVFQNISLHSDSELVELLEREIISRRTVHEWPLSCVQEIQLSDGTKVIYKSQLPPSVEVKFYERATSDLVPGHKVIGKLGNCDTMLIEWIPSPPLNTRKCSKNELVKHGREIVERIGQIKGELPTYIDIGSVEAWTEVTSNTLERLREILNNNRFQSLNHNMIMHMEKWTQSGNILDTVDDDPRVTHGDLKTDQIFVTPAGYKLIDWQRPILAPPDIDLVSLLVEEHIEPLEYVNASVAGIFWFLRLRWAVEAEVDLFPGNQWTLFEHWASEAANQILRIAAL